jgi:hypothetical protein
MFVYFVKCTVHLEALTKHYNLNGNMGFKFLYSDAASCTTHKLLQLIKITHMFYACTYMRNLICIQKINNGHFDKYVSTLVKNC